MIRICEEGHIFYDEDFLYNDECANCESTRFKEIKDSNAILGLAFQHKDNKERAHKLADEALLARLDELDSEFANQYRKLREHNHGFWHS